MLTLPEVVAFYELKNRTTSIIKINEYQTD